MSRMNTEQNKKVEEILSSLDGCARASAPEFFYTRLQARMEKEITRPERPAWVFRPAFAVATLVVVLLVNAFVLLQRRNTENNITSSDTDNLQSVAAEYRLNDNNSIYDLASER